MLELKKLCCTFNAVSMLPHSDKFKVYHTYKYTYETCRNFLKQSEGVVMGF